MRKYICILIAVLLSVNFSVQAKPFVYCDEKEAGECIDGKR